MIKVLFVCLGNICRSPTAEGVFRELVRRQGLEGHIETDSAGTGSWHVGGPPDSRSAEAARRRGIDISDLRARQTEPADFERFDYLLAMDRQNHASLLAMCPPGHRGKLHMFLDFSDDATAHEVPDPYHGGANGFEAVLDMIERASLGLLADIRSRHL